MTSDKSFNINDPIISTMLGEYQKLVDTAFSDFVSNEINARIWAHDYTVWKPEPEEISNRLGWLDIAERMQAAIPNLISLAESLHWEGYRQAVLLGMGGSSLAPEVFCKTFGHQKGFLDLAVLDSTDPGAILSLEKKLDLVRTVFIVSTKSGTTTETLSFFKYFYNRVIEKLGSEQAGKHFIAITDPDSKMVELATHFQFRSVFTNDPNIGGRYSALSYFGLVPAVLVGVDITRLLHEAVAMALECKSADNPGGFLGVILGELAKAGRDKVTFILSPKISSFGDWVEQLIAESTGKSGKGILPVVGESLGPALVYGSDRLFVSIQLEGDTPHEAKLGALKEAGHPVLRLHLKDCYKLGGQFFLWELATAVAGYCLEIQPFDQPNVEAAKILARQIISDYTRDGVLPEMKPAELLPIAMQTFLNQAEHGAYIAIQAYLKPDADIGQALLELRSRLREHTHLATTLGYGPRFLHSTGQLHKGDAGKGLFIQLNSRIAEDANIPDEAGKQGSSLSFGTLKTAQVMGDQQALLKAGRKVIYFELGANSKEFVEQLAEIIKHMD